MTLFKQDRVAGGRGIQVCTELRQFSSNLSGITSGFTDF
jgi:hypothetical protein